MTSTIRFHIMNTYGRNLHIGVVTRNDFDLDCKITDKSFGYGLYVREWRPRNNESDGAQFQPEATCGNDSYIDVILDRVAGTLRFRGKPAGEDWKDTGIAYTRDEFINGDVWFAISVNDKEDRIKIVKPE